jgi:hypothetical protein
MTVRFLNSLILAAIIYKNNTPRSSPISTGNATAVTPE